MDMIGGKSAYWLWEHLETERGNSSSANSISHGCPPTRHRQINVINTGRKAE
jgi:TldD protein